MSEDKTGQEVTAGPGISRRGLLKGGAGGALAGIAGVAGLSLGAAGVAQAAEGAGFPKHPKWRFTFINHVTTNPFFVPTRYGAADACKLLGCEYQWAGSRKSVASQMVNDMNAAIASQVDGIAVAMVDQVAFDEPIKRALDAGIPVVSYNANDTTPNDCLAYIGQSLFAAGKALGERIVAEVDSGEVVGFIATPGQLNIQPRLDGAKAAIEASGKDITLHEVATGPTINEEFSRVEAYYLGHKNVKGMFAVDAGSTAAVANTVKKYGLADKGIVAGGFDMLPQTLDGIKAGNLSFTIDQQPYLQGFYPVLELFLFKASGGLTGPANVNTGLKFITKGSVDAYLQTKSRYEGNSKEPKIIQRSGPISV